MVKSFVWAMVTFSALGVSASVWTGAGDDNRWVNPANWDGGVPGVYQDAGGSTVTGAASAVFGAAGNAQRTIDLEGLVGVSRLEIAGGSEPYVFGTSQAQKLGIIHDGALVVNAGAHCPVIAATLLKVANAEYGYWSTPSGRNRPGFAITNLADETFVIGKFSGYAGSVNPAECALWLCGDGDFKFTENIDTVGGSSHISHRTTGVVTLDGCIVKVREWLCDVDHPAGKGNFRELVINAGAALGACASPYGMLVLNKDYRIRGEGDLLFADGRQVATAAQLEQYASIGLYNRWVDNLNTVGNADIEIVCRCVLQDPNRSNRPAGYEVGIPFSGYWGNVKLLGDASAIKGAVSLNASKFIVNTLGMKAENPSTGSGDFIMTASARLEYTGEGESTDRGIVITNGMPMVSTDVNNNAKIKDNVPYWVRLAATAFVIQSGTGELHMQGNVNASVTNSLLVLQGEVTTDAYWDGVLADNPCGQDELYCALSIAKRGAGIWHLSAANTFTGSVAVEGGRLVIDADGSIADASQLELKSGTLEVASAASTSAATLPPTVVSGTAQLKIGSNRMVTLDGLTRVGSGKLDIVSQFSTSKIVIDGLTDGDAPAWLTFNGQAAKYSAADGLYSDAYSVWKSATGGNWTEADKWQPSGVPAANRSVMLWDNLAPYAVTINADRALVSNVTVGTEEAEGSVNTATLTVENAKLDVAGSKLAVQGNGRVSLANGANVVYDNHEIVPYSFKDSILNIDHGGELTVGEGATLSFTNFHGQVNIGDKVTGSAGKLTVDGGALQFFTYPRASSSAPKNNESYITVHSGGVLEFKGNATFDFGNGAANDFYGVLHNQGGKVIYGGDTLVRLWNVWYLGKEGGTAYGDFVSCVYYPGNGETTFKDNARIDVNHTSAIDASFAVMPLAGSSNPTCQVSFVDHAGFASTRAATKRAAFRVNGGGYSGGIGVGVLNLFSDSAHNATAPSQATVAHSIFVGDAVGLGVFNITNGSINAGSCNFQIGKCDGNNGCRGIVNVSGKGKIGLYGTGASSPAWTTSEIYRFSVGDMNAKVLDNATVEGELNVADEGYVENMTASFMVGYGPGAIGRVNVAGGTVLSCTKDYSTSYGSNTDYPNQKFWYTNHVFVVGMKGGRGVWTQTGGKVDSYHRVYIGGCSTNELKVYSQYRDTHKDGVKPERYPAEFAANKWGANHSAEGTVKLLGGEWICRHECRMGMDGKGTLEIGPAGSFKADTLYLDANAANPHAAHLKFTFGANGVGSIEATNLVIAAGSKLTVDLTDYANIHPGNLLVKATAVEGAFAAEDVEIIGNDVGRLRSAYVDQTPYGIRLCVPSGTAIYLR